MVSSLQQPSKGKTSDTIEVVPLTLHIGAEIRGVDLSKTVDDATLRAIEDALHEHEVVFFRDQHISPGEHVAFSRRLGELEKHPRVECCKPGFPEILVVSDVI
jgi:taurine dioxygenase